MRRRPRSLGSMLRALDLELWLWNTALPVAMVVFVALLVLVVCYRGR